PAQPTWPCTHGWAVSPAVERARQVLHFELGVSAMPSDLKVPALPRSTRDSLFRKRPNGASYEHPLAFWVGVTITTVGVLLQLPMFLMSKEMHYHLAGMPVTPEMAVGMAMLFVGVAVTMYSLVPASANKRPELVRVSIAPLDDARIRPAHIGLLLVMAAAIT